MASFVVFNGITRFIPGGITKINDDALNQIVLGDNSIVGVVGEAEGGPPGAVSGVLNFADDLRAKERFRSGPMVDAAPLAFSPSNDTDIPGGASLMRFYKTNNSTQSSVSLPASDAANVLTSTSTSGGASALIDTVLGSTFADDFFNGKWLVIRPFTATTEVRRVTDYDGTTQTFTVGTAWSVAPVTDAYFVLENEVVLTEAVDVGASSSTVVAIDVTATTLVVDAHIGRTIFIQDAAGVSFKRKVVSNTVSAFTVTPALPATPTAGSYVEVLSNSIDLVSSDWGAHTNGITADIADGIVVSGSVIATLNFEGVDEISPEVGGNAFFQLLYRGGAEAIGDVASGTPSTTVIDLVTGGLTPGIHVGTQVLINGEFTTITANTASQITVSPALSDAPDAGDAVSIRTVLGGTMEISGASGVATTLTTTINGVIGDDLSETFPPNMTLRDLANLINANPSYLAVIPNAVNADVALAADFDFGVNTNVTVLNSAELTSAGLFQDTVALVNYFNDFSELAFAARSTDDVSEGGRFPAAFAAGEDPVAFSGGTRGVSTNSNFQAGLDAMLNVRVNSTVPLIDQDLVNEGFSSTATVASVAAQLGAHVLSARGVDNTERGGFIGFRGTKDETIAQLQAINDFDVAMTAQQPTALNSSGSLQLFGPREFAAMMAGARAGVTEVGTPLTHKVLRITAVTQDPSWDPTDRGDATEMIQAGLLFHDGEKIVRDLTTHTLDNNLAKSEGSVRDVVRFIAFGIRTFLVNRFIGEKASPATIGAVKDAVVEFLDVQRDNNIIVDSTDPSTGEFVRAFHNVKVTSSGDTLRVNFGMFPAVGINFILNEIFVQLPTQSA